jgi:hypothetical protein
MNRKEFSTKDRVSRINCMKVTLIYVLISYIYKQTYESQ